MTFYCPRTRDRAIQWDEHNLSTIMETVLNWGYPLTFTVNLRQPGLLVIEECGVAVRGDWLVEHNRVLQLWKEALFAETYRRCE